MGFVASDSDALLVSSFVLLLLSTNGARVFEQFLYPRLVGDVDVVSHDLVKLFRSLVFRSEQTEYSGRTGSKLHLPLFDSVAS